MLFLTPLANIVSRRFLHDKSTILTLDVAVLIAYIVLAILFVANEARKE